MLRPMAETRDLPPTRWRRFGDHHLMFTEADTPVPEQVWDPVMVALDDAELKGCLSIVGGDGLARLTKPQWEVSSSIINERGFPVAVITSHRVTRSMVKAASWIGGNIRAYCWAELDAALAFIGVPALQRDACRIVAEQLRAGSCSAL